MAYVVTAGAVGGLVNSLILCPVDQLKVSCSRIN